MRLGGRFFVAPANGAIARVLLGLALLGLMTAIVRTAWITEDAYITFRVVDNVLAGLGPVWNAGERVQAYTHPLWFFLLLPATAMAGDPYWAALFLSMACSLGAVALFVDLTWRRPLACVAVLACLCASRAFVDYSTSGLENPLLHLLVLAFIRVWTSEPSANRLPALGLIAAATYLTRPDAIVLLAPALGVVAFRSWRSVPFVLSAALPVGLWTLFSLWYYGAPVPNTALAKVGTGIALDAKVVQASALFFDTLKLDPISIIVVLAGLILGLMDRAHRWIAVGLAAWLGYYFFVGGDYMLGRFFSASVLVGALLVARVASGTFLALVPVLLLAQLGRFDVTIGSPSAYSNTVIFRSGLADERGYYYSSNGMMPKLFGNAPRHPWLVEGASFRGETAVHVRCTIGMAAYAAGPHVHWVDPLALTDPLLSRLPARSNTRVGHSERAIPPGYLRWRASGGEPALHGALRALFDDVVLATSGPLWSVDRLGAVWRLNSGHHGAAGRSHDREATALPGWRVVANDPLSCVGQPLASAWTYRIEPDGTAVRIQ